MTKKEYIENYCKGCPAFTFCSYRAYNKQCHLVDNIDDIWEACKTNMIDKACDWLKFEGGVKWIDDNIYYHHMEECIESFKKAMEE